MDITSFLDLAAKQVGFRIDETYCQFSGAPIGPVDLSVFDAIIGMGKYDLTDESDREDLIRDLLTRCLASSRPSPVWNKPDANTYDWMRVNRPRDLFCYLFSRLIAPVDTDFLKRPKYDSLELIRQRILLYKRVSARTDDLSTLNQTLLGLDAVFNLNRISYKLSRDDSDLIALASILDDEFAAMSKAKAKADRIAAREAEWFKGNSLARKGYVSAFVESKPVTPASAERKAKDEKRVIVKNKVSALLANVLGSSTGIVPADHSAKESIKQVATKSAIGGGFAAALMAKAKES